MPMDQRSLEKYSSAITLSDMEIFIFPELLYSLVLANIMSPIVWGWRDDPWFAKIERMSPYRRVMRLRQFIVEQFEFNLDLETWGLTQGEREMARFAPFIDPEIIRSSNALFGYEGDKYYFDIDIRRHFGLDKYEGDIIPYWKTETLEAMCAFRHKENYATGAGECVSLSTLYAAALFVVCRIPLKDIFLLATPLHSQNFILVRDGLLTNNRRVVTRNMWFNGTELSARAQRALRHEQVTVVSHHTGHVHVAYPEATIDPDAYHRMETALRAFLITPEFDTDVLVNFLRQHSELQSCFQFEHSSHGQPRYITAEKVYAYEHGSPHRANQDTRDHLMESIDIYEFFREPIGDRIILNHFVQFFKENPVSLTDPVAMENLVQAMDCPNARFKEIMQKLMAFCLITPRLPGENKSFASGDAIALETSMDREAIIAHLEGLRPASPTADLAFYAYRDLARTDWAPFLKAAMERNPVCIEASRTWSEEEVLRHVQTCAPESIYDGTRMAQPDEVWNFSRGDGWEKAICLAAIWKSRYPTETSRITSDGHTVHWRSGGAEASFPTMKALEKDLTL